ELQGAAREAALSRAVAELSKHGRRRDDALASGARASELRGPRDTDPRAARARRSASGRLDSAALDRLGHRAGARQPALPMDDRSAAAMPRYRIVIERGPADTRSRVEFSTRAPSARGAVAAQLAGGHHAVSAANEADPADRFSWRPDGTCRCTAIALADQPN